MYLISGKKSVPFSVKIFFFGLHLICSPEQNRDRGSFPPMLKIGQNWGKIANYPPNAQQRSAPLILPTRKHIKFMLESDVSTRALWQTTMQSVMKLIKVSNV